jgi:hypothetical protein
MTRPVTAFATVRADLLEVRTIRRCGASLSAFVAPGAFRVAYRAARAAALPGEVVRVIPINEESPL